MGSIRPVGSGHFRHRKSCPVYLVHLVDKGFPVIGKPRQIVSLKSPGFLAPGKVFCGPPSFHEVGIEWQGGLKTVSPRFSPYHDPPKGPPPLGPPADRDGAYSRGVLLEPVPESLSFPDAFSFGEPLFHFNDGDRESFFLGVLYKIDEDGEVP